MVEACLNLNKKFATKQAKIFFMAYDSRISVWLIKVVGRCLSFLKKRRLAPLAEAIVKKSTLTWRQRSRIRVPLTNSSQVLVNFSREHQCIFFPRFKQNLRFKSERSHSKSTILSRSTVTRSVWGYIYLSRIYSVKRCYFNKIPRSPKPPLPF